MACDCFLKFYLDEKFAELGGKEDKIMGALKTLADSLDALSTAQGAQAESLANIAADVAHLQALIAAGGTITEAQLQPLADRAAAAATGAAATAASMKSLADSVPDEGRLPPDDNP